MAMHTEYEIVKYTPEFKQLVLELQRYLWNPELAVNAAYLEWKYERNPYTASPLIYLALEQGRVVGMRGFYAAQWQTGCDGHTWLGLCAGDSVIAPEHRNRGLLSQITRTALAELASSGCTYILNLSASQVTYMAALAMRWRSLGAFQTMQRRGQGTRLDDPFQRVDQNWHKQRYKATAAVCLAQDPRPEAMTDLVARLPYDGRIRHVPEQRYFAWRFQNPLSRYRFLFWEDGQVEGYLVLQARRYKNTRRVNIVDWQAAHAEVLTDLLQTAVQVGDFDRLALWSSTLSEETKALLQHAGFTLEESAGDLAHYRPALLVRPADDATLQTDWVLANRHISDLANWDLRMIYCDTY